MPASRAVRDVVFVDGARTPFGKAGPKGIYAETHTVLAQNLLASDVVRRLSWAPPAELDEAGITARLTELGARPWQIALTVEPLVAALNPTP